MEIRTVDLKKVQEKSPSIYEAIIVAAQKARQINAEERLEFNALIKTMSPQEDEFEEKDNPDRINISMEFDKKLKPHIAAIRKFMAEGIEFRYKDI